MEEVSRTEVAYARLAIKRAGRTDIKRITPSVILMQILNMRLKRMVGKRKRCQYCSCGLFEFKNWSPSNKLHNIRRCNTCFAIYQRGRKNPLGKKSSMSKKVAARLRQRAWRAKNPTYGQEFYKLTKKRKARENRKKR